MQLPLAWFLLGAAVGLLIGALLSFVMGGPAWPYLLTTGAGSSLAALFLFLRSASHPIGGRRLHP